MNWGMKIVLSLGIFMLGIAAAGIYMVSHDSDSLEEGDYYEQALNYDDMYARKQNVLDYQAQPRVRLQADTLYIQFKSQENIGKLNFKKPSDASLDLELPLHTKNGVFQISVADLKAGLWNLEIFWEADAHPYYTVLPITR